MVPPAPRLDLEARAALYKGTCSAKRRARGAQSGTAMVTVWSQAAALSAAPHSRPCERCGGKVATLENCAALVLPNDRFYVTDTRIRR